MSRTQDIHELRKRRVYLIALALSIAVIVTLMIVQGSDDPLLRVLHPAVLLLATALLVATWQQLLPFRAVELAILATGVLSVLGALVAWRLGWSGQQPLAQQTATLLWVTMLYPLAFLVLGKRRGLLAALAILVTVAGLVGSILFAEGVGAPTPPQLPLLAGNIAGLHAMLITLLWVLASRFETMIAARSRAELLAQQATTDPLPGLANRRALTDELDRGIARAHRSGRPLAVISVDLDHFKRVNDTYGHGCGDRVLADVAQLLVATTRSGDLVGRWGGEELLLIAPDADQRSAVQLAERCRQAIGSQTFACVGTLTVSLGVATLAEGEDRRALLRRADLSLYAAKSQGRDRVVALGAPPADAHIAEPGAPPTADGTAGHDAAPDDPARSTR